MKASNGNGGRARLILFDIDGTLLNTGGATRSALIDAVRRVTGRPVPADLVDFVGNTDIRIVRGVLSNAGITGPAAVELITPVLEAYYRRLPDELPRHPLEVFPGVTDLLDRLDHDERVTLGLITGNSEPSAYMKLSAAGLRKYFQFGAFGSDSEDRNELPPIAIRRARERTGVDFQAADAWIVGDSERDIACARAHGIPSLIVTTGFQSASELQPLNPTVLIDDFRDTEAVLRILR